jgi:hypothetical protein
MRPTTRRLVSVSVLLVVVSIVGTVLAWWQPVLYDPGDPTPTVGELIIQGSIVSIPLPPLTALVVFTLLAPNRRWWGTLAVVGLCLLAVVFTAASLAEVLDPYTPRYPSAVLFPSVVVYILLGLSLLVSGIAELVNRVRARRQASRVR